MYSVIYRYLILKTSFVASGGQVVYLHGDKPFLRGGDFFQRHSLGHHPKQLNYSRAFGGKGLKKYGLIAGKTRRAIAIPLITMC